MEAEQLSFGGELCPTCGGTRRVPVHARSSDTKPCPECNRPDPGRAMPGKYHRHGPDTERQAAAAITPRTGSQRAKVLKVLRDVGEDGRTDNELHFIDGIGARPHVPGARRGELIEDGWPIIDSGRRRRTDQGYSAIVWVLREKRPA